MKKALIAENVQVIFPELQKARILSMVLDCVITRPVVGSLVSH